MNVKVKVEPRIIIHGGAGNIRWENMSAEQYHEYRRTLLEIVTSTNTYMRTPKSTRDKTTNPSNSSTIYPSALEAATYAVVKLEDSPLFNSGHGAVFTRDGINELEASVMVSRGFAKCGVGVTGLRSVRNPILLARAMLERGERDLVGKGDEGWAVENLQSQCPAQREDVKMETEAEMEADLDVPSAQGHTLIHGWACPYALKTPSPSFRRNSHISTFRYRQNNFIA